VTKRAIKKITLLLAILIIGAGGLAIALLAPADRLIAADAAAVPETASQDVSAGGEAGFLDYDMVIGDRDAPVEIIEYAAISCSHCAHFHQDVLPELKKKYLDTGKARLVYRNFIFDNPFDVYASLLTRCATRENFFSTVKTYFDYQKAWLKVAEMQQVYQADGRDAAIIFAQAEVAKIAKMAGMSDEDVRQCYDNQQAINYLLQIRKTAVETYGVNSTPTLIVGGKKVESNDLVTLEKAIAEAGK